MRLLTNNNHVFDMNNMPNEVEDLRYCVLDYSDQADVDFFFVPMILLETFTSASALLQVGKFQLQIPLDWSLVIGDKHVGDLEILEVNKLNDRPFSTFVLNPINGFSPQFMEVTIIDIFPDIKWHLPKLKFGHILAVPLGDRHEWPVARESIKSPPCLFMVRDVGKLPETLDISKIFP
jgi:hypothetical protein